MQSPVLLVVAAVLVLLSAYSVKGTTVFYGPYVKYAGYGDTFGAVNFCEDYAAVFGGHRVEVQGFEPKLDYVNQVVIGEDAISVMVTKRLLRNITGNVALSVKPNRVYTMQVHTELVNSNFVMSFNYTNCTKWQFSRQIDAPTFPADLQGFGGAIVAKRHLLWGGGEHVLTGLPSNAVLAVDSQTDFPSLLSLSSARTGVAVASASDGKVWFAGGANRATQTLYSTIDVFDSNLDIDSDTFALSQARAYLGGGSTDGVIVFAGGVEEYTDLGDGTIEAVYSNVVDIFDLSTKKRSTAELSVARGGVAATATDDFIVFSGGATRTVYNASNWAILEEEVSDRVDIYHVASNTWSITRLAEPRTRASSVPVGNGFMVTPGSYYTNETATYTSLAEVFLLVYTSPAASVRPFALFSFLYSLLA